MFSGNVLAWELGNLKFLEMLTLKEGLMIHRSESFKCNILIKSYLNCFNKSSRFNRLFTASLYFNFTNIVISACLAGNAYQPNAQDL